MARMFFCSDSMVWSRAHASKCEYHERQAAAVAVSWAFHEKDVNTAVVSILAIPNTYNVQTATVYLAIKSKYHEVEAATVVTMLAGVNITEVKQQLL
jgi:hypothetical protein